MSTPLPILKEQIENYFSKSLAADVDQATLRDAMNYSLMAGGKRLRPALTLATIEMLGGTLLLLRSVLHQSQILDLSVDLTIKLLQHVIHNTSF